MPRQMKSEAQHKMEGTLSQHRYYLKRKAAREKAPGEQSHDPELLARARKAWPYWLMGYEEDCPFEDADEAEAAWRTVEDEFYEDYTIGAIDDRGQVNYFPAAWWLFDCPEAPFEPEPIDGLKYSCQVRQHEALIRWGIIPEGTPAPVLQGRAAEIERLYQRKMSGNDNFLPFCYGTTKAEMDAKWQEVSAERAAWVRLGYLTD